ncbi:Aspartyl-tRNA(Asn) amidotransferase subunit A @ Glutamyl-tRNA(Gln) amidotransferase subunit A [hydrothermal vent metagenome]|uniref:glutaminyl-tRNA synthase (glutamine-hydrolyzing) n=1 Tax=hydrothermal vent metagenome TaxID=652676 RepID=A0A3B1CKW0_9ZZZZ
MTKLPSLTIHELTAKLGAGEITSEQVTKAYIERISTIDKKINSYVTIDEANALDQAREADRKRSKGDNSPLLGVPMGIKDLISTKGLKTTCSSKMLESFVPSYDAYVIKKLKEAGAVIIGKLNMDEFAMGSSTETSHTGPTRNPWDTDKIPGGSSGGSAAAVSADLCAGALGSDTGGSIRQPASLCGVVGLKPTYGRVSRFGLIAFASSLDQIGPMTKDVEDAAILMNVIAGYDEMDSTCANEPLPDYTADLDKGVKGLTIGVPDEYFVEGMDPEIDQNVREIITGLQNEGAEIKKISLPHTKYGVPTYYVIAPAEASSNLARYDGVRYGFRAEGTEGLLDMYSSTRMEGFGPEVKRRIMLGTYALSSGYYDAYYLKAQKVRTLIKNDFVDAFKEVDVIVTPTTPTPAFGIGEKTDDCLQMYLSDIFTINCNLSGIPGLSTPCGFTSGGLPIGFQVMGDYFDEATVLRVGKVVENIAGVKDKRPSLP